MRPIVAVLLLIAMLWPAAPCMAQERAITVYMTVDWEGWTIEDDNLDAMRDFRRRFPHIPMLHLLNPVYFLRPGADPATLTEKIRTTLLPGDGQGLHLHPWKSLVRHCGLPYRDEPTFATLDENCGNGECGYTVSLELAYTEEELTRLVGCSAGLLVDHGFERPRAFRAGGWQQGPRLATALKANGFTFDSSRTDARLLTSRWAPDSNLVRLVAQLHPGANPLDQPYELLPGLTEYPNNGSLADYTSAPQLLEIFRSLLANGKLVLVLGFHQETAFNYLGRLEEAIPLLEAEATRTGARLEWASYR